MPSNKPLVWFRQPFGMMIVIHIILQHMTFGFAPENVLNHHADCAVAIAGGLLLLAAEAIQSKKVAKHTCEGFVPATTGH